MGYAFISYSTKNQAAADAIRNLFNRHKIDTWMAPYDIPVGSKYAAVITKAIRECSCFVLLLSNDSQASDAVDKEVELAAVFYKKSIITVEIEKVVLNDSFTFYIHNQQIIAIQEIDENSAEIQQVLSVVRTYTGEGSASLEAPQVATENEVAPDEASDFIIEDGVLVKYNGEAKHVVVPNGVTTIGPFAFEWRTSLTSITIPDSVTSIGEKAFFWCKSLTSITIPNSVKSIGSSAFLFCSSFTSITIPDSVISIGDGAFHGCESLTELNISFNLLLKSKKAFDEKLYKKLVVKYAPMPEDEKQANVNMNDFVIENGVLVEYKGTSMDVIIPDGIVEIGERCFKEKNIKSVEIPNTVKCIGNRAFEKCKTLVSITIPYSVTSIGENAFYNCEKLTSITIPDNVTSIGSSVFENCSSLTSITIPDSVKSIGVWAFRFCTSLTSITIPNRVTSIDYGAFPYCTNLTSITVDSANEYYNSVDGVLFNKAQTELIQYPAGKTNTTYVIPDSVTSICGDAFSYCKNLTSITIPNSVTSIDFGAFDGCTSLTSITIPNSVTRIDDCAFSWCSNLTSITIPNSVKSIGINAFSGCYKLNDINISHDLLLKSSIAFDYELYKKLVARGAAD